MGLLGQGEKPSEAEMDRRCEEIRQAKGLEPRPRIRFGAK